MTSIQTGIPLTSPDIKPIDMSKLKPVNVAEASEDVYQRFVMAQEGFLKARYTFPSADLFKTPTYIEYAQVKVGDETVATVFNDGSVQSSNAMGGKISSAIRIADEQAGALQGPLAAEARAAEIAGMLGGHVVKSSTAMTQAEYLAAPKPTSVVDYQAMMNDPMYQQLQKTKEARTLFLSQQIAQEQGNEMQAASGNPAQEFLEYMSKTPEERYYEAILAEKGLTKEQLAALPPEEQAKILEDIEREIKERIAADMSEAA